MTTVGFKKQIHVISKDKYPKIFSCQMEAIVFIVLHTFFATHQSSSKLENTTRIFPSFSWSLFSHAMYLILDQSLVNKKMFDGL